MSVLGFLWEMVISASGIQHYVAASVLLELKIRVTSPNKVACDLLSIRKMLLCSFDGAFLIESPIGSLQTP